MRVFWADTATYELEQILSYWTIPQYVNNIF